MLTINQNIYYSIKFNESLIISIKTTGDALHKEVLLLVKIRFEMRLSHCKISDWAGFLWRQTTNSPIILLTWQRNELIYKKYFVILF